MKIFCLLIGREAWNIWATISLEDFASNPSWFPFPQALAKAICSGEKHMHKKKRDFYQMQTKAVENGPVIFLVKTEQEKNTWKNY